jgi:hypothetical protein
MVLSRLLTLLNHSMLLALRLLALPRPLNWMLNWPNHSR